MTPWTVACQAPLTMEFSRQKYWSGLPCPPPGVEVRDAAKCFTERRTVLTTENFLPPDVNSVEAGEPWHGITLLRSPGARTLVSHCLCCHTSPAWASSEPQFLISKISREPHLLGFQDAQGREETAPALGWKVPLQ